MSGYAPFSCPACGYEAEVAGRPDGGFEVRTRTIVCTDCGQLHDMIAWERLPASEAGPRDESSAGAEAGAEGGEDWAEMEPRCPVCVEHTWEYWEFPGPCPRCGVTMQRHTVRVTSG